MKFCCVTPCYNAEKHIEQTLISVLSQSVLKDGSSQLHYIVKDGSSNDGTMEIIEKIASDYRYFKNITIEIKSQVDNGMYDALAMSFKNLPEGDVYSYINAGDYYSVFAFEIVREIFTLKRVQFLTGLNCIYNVRNHLLRCDLPYKYKKSLMMAGYYGTMLPHVQQESTFWGRKLHTTIDLDCLKKARLAGDYLLWKTFFKYEQLYIVSAQLGGFKIHKGQLTENSYKEYREEINQLAERGTILSFLTALIYRLCWLLPNKIKIRLSKHTFEYDHIKKIYNLPNKW